MCGIREVSRSSMVDPADGPGGQAVTVGALRSGLPPRVQLSHRRPAGRAPGAGPPAPQGKPAA